jgi:predicted nuclease of predicted toxin-antitoxin system
VNLVCDEGVDRQVVDRLRRDGHDVAYVAELNPGITDEDVLAIAEDRRALLLVSDKDFGELVFR